MERLLMLTKKTQIRIIKHAEREDSRAAGWKKRPLGGRNRREKPTRDAITVITEWIGELRRKKAEEGTRGFQSLFGK
jgi:hypothetical protein